MQETPSHRDLFGAGRNSQGHSAVRAVNGQEVEFADVCRFYLGERAYMVAAIFSVVTLLGASMVYWVLMSNFLFNIVDYAHGAWVIFTVVGGVMSGSIGYSGNEGG